MKENLLKIINHYGVMQQLKYFQSEVFELNETIIKRETLKDYYFKNDNWLKEHIAEEIADVLNMVEQFMYYYNIDFNDVIDIKHQKINRQLERVKNENN